MSEAVAIGTSVVRVHASDEDSGPGGNVRYELAPTHPGSDDVNYFNVDHKSGVVVTSRVLDHEIHAELQFLAVATDGGIPSLNSTVLVKVIIEDLNDSPPTFDQPSYDCTITNQESGQIVTKVMASDPDVSSQGNLIYAIVGGNDEQIFRMNPTTGVITLTRRNGGQLYHSYTVNVSVTDGVFTSFARVGITIRDSNQHAPVFRESPYTVSVMENLGPGMLVSTLTADDADFGDNGLPTYSIPSDYMRRFFDIDSDTGTFPFSFNKTASVNDLIF